MKGYVSQQALLVAIAGIFSFDALPMQGVMSEYEVVTNLSIIL